VSHGKPRRSGSRVIFPQRRFGRFAQRAEITWRAFFAQRGSRVARPSGMSLVKTITLVCAGALLAFAGTAVAAFI
jgi:hypothetical protein